MASYISSNANRFYTALESAYGKSGIDHGHQSDSGCQARRSGSRSRQGRDAIRRGAGHSRGCRPGARRRTAFDLQTYLTSWDKAAAGPGYGPLFEAAMGGTSGAVRRRDGGIEHASGAARVSERRTDWRRDRQSAWEARSGS